MYAKSLSEIVSFALESGNININRSQLSFGIDNPFSQVFDSEFIGVEFSGLNIELSCQTLNLSIEILNSVVDFKKLSINFLDFRVISQSSLFSDVFSDSFSFPELEVISELFKLESFKVYSIIRSFKIVNLIFFFLKEIDDLSITFIHGGSVERSSVHS